MEKLAILIPAYNEAQTITKVIENVKNASSDISGTKIYVYDNNSTDNTIALAEKAGAIVRHEYIQGKGAVIRRMFREIDAHVYIMIDADDTYPVEAIPEMYQRVVSHNADMVVGDRLSSTYFEENTRPFHNLGNSMVRSTINFLFHTQINDILTGYRAFSYQFVKTFPVLSRGFEIETEMSIHATEKNMAVENQVIEYRDRPEGSESKLNTYSDGLRVLNTLGRLFRIYHPLAFFGVLASVLFSISAISFWFRVFIPFWNTARVDNFPTLIVTAFIVMAGVISLFSGLILDAIQSQEQRSFEFELRKVQEKENEKA
ncbi:glycosyltransferase family 2 protein [Leuconostoc gasicomitatum]|uniref:glycosyltransferase family 2 protein n=1 Tax=Leuconostoc gasicomitatum TaxID=115778 RepID=UPI001CC57AB0|nr:glycosyltransferase family 2 protein [Leuconostoc gasicomitatum]MBZ5955493.1 glycosyltransferase [Leuconostoc gasicomitatum]MBZ5984314.1 glycosyltransferase [Leuconostoc gasicomitatum]